MALKNRHEHKFTFRGKKCGEQCKLHQLIELAKHPCFARKDYKSNNDIASEAFSRQIKYMQQQIQEYENKIEILQKDLFNDRGRKR